MRALRIMSTCLTLASLAVACGGQQAQRLDDLELGGSSAGGSSAGDSSEGGSSAGGSSLDSIVPSTCNLSACGGDIVGTWRLVGTCLDPVNDDGAATSLAVCTGMLGARMAESTLTFTADGMSTQVYPVQTTQSTYAYSMDCLSILRETTFTSDTFSDACAGLTMGARVEGGLARVSCEVSAEDCVCSRTTTFESESSTSDAYSTSGTTLTLYGVNFDYCVEGNTLRFGSMLSGSIQVYEKSP